MATTSHTLPLTLAGNPTQPIPVKGSTMTVHLTGTTIGSAVVTIEGAIESGLWVTHDTAPTIDASNPLRRNVYVSGYKFVRLKVTTADAAASSDAVAYVDFYHGIAPQLTTDDARRLLVETNPAGSAGLLYSSLLTTTSATNIIAPSSGVVRVDGLFVHNVDPSATVSVDIHAGVDGSEVVFGEAKLGAGQTWELVAVPMWIASGETLQVTAGTASKINVVATGATI